MRKYIVAGNWKMNTTPSEGVQLAKDLTKQLEAKGNLKTSVMIAPPFTHLSEVSKVIDADKICLAAQNCASEEGGAYTGEVAIGMLKEIGVKAVLIGHSERRSYYNEDDAILNKKVKIVLNNGLKPVFCCGEVLEERQSEKHFDVIKSQVEKALFDLSPDMFSKVIIAYEPVWAIGTGVVASAAQAQEMHAFIRNLIANKFGNEMAQDTTILYGGSCKPSNAEELFANEDVDGGLIGGAALKAEDFMGIIDGVKSEYK